MSIWMEKPHADKYDICVFFFTFCGQYLFDFYGWYLFHASYGQGSK